MKDTLRRICELQPHYSSTNTVEMQERGRLIRQALVEKIKLLHDPLASALGPFGTDLLVERSDGIGRKTELAWARFCSEGMSPRPTDGYNVVLHFSTDGSGVNIAVGCSSSKFHNGYNIILPLDKLDRKCEWVRSIVEEELGKLHNFTDDNKFGARAKLPQSFERACALVKKVDYDDIDDVVIEDYLIQAANILRIIYSAQNSGRELSPADQAELDIHEITRPASNARRGQGFGLNAQERRAVELRAMDLAETWLVDRGYSLKNTTTTKPYDFEASSGDERLYFEVKGTTTDMADAIAMTHGEVDLHRREKGSTALIIVTSIRLVRDSKSAQASGGDLEAIIGWDIDDWFVKPTVFRVSRMPD